MRLMQKYGNTPLYAATDISELIALEWSHDKSKQGVMCVSMPNFNVFWVIAVYVRNAQRFSECLKTPRTSPGMLSYTTLFSKHLTLCSLERRLKCFFNFRTTCIIYISFIFMQKNSIFLYRYRIIPDIRSGLSNTAS
jgi:hypothetical protein